MAADFDVAGRGAVASILRTRRTVHDFCATPIPDELIVAGIDLARWAPNHHRTEPWRFYLLGPQAQREICQLNADLVRAAKGDRPAEIKFKRWSAMPGWLVLSCLRSDDVEREREDYAACCCAVHILMTYLWSYGIGMKWTTGEVVRQDAFYAAAGIDVQAEFVVGMFWYGEPAVVPDQQRRPLENCLTRVP